MAFATPSQAGHMFLDMTPNVRCSSRDPHIKFYFKTSCLSFKCEQLWRRDLSRFRNELRWALPHRASADTVEDTWNSGEMIRAAIFARPGVARCILFALARGTAKRRCGGGAALGGREASAQRHSRRLVLLDRASGPLLSANYDYSEPQRY